ncbi:MAG: hypothetical protein ACJAU2_000773 [Maribacter sp.]|jgi:hypothetical protein
MEKGSKTNNLVAVGKSPKRASSFLENSFKTTVIEILPYCALIFSSRVHA